MANNGHIWDFNVFIEANEHSASNYHFIIFKNQKTWWPSWIFHQNFTKIKNSYKMANNGRNLNFKVSTEVMDILLQTIILKFSKTKKHGGHLGYFTKISPKLQTANNGWILIF